MLRVTTKSQAGDTYISPFIQLHESPLQIPVDVTAFTANEVTTDGFLKPGVVIGKQAGANGGLIGLGAAGDIALVGVTVELAKVATSNSGADLAAAGNSGVVQVAIGCEGVVARAHAEEMLGRVYTADEVAALRGPVSKIILHEA